MLSDERQTVVEYLRREAPEIEDDLVARFLDVYTDAHTVFPPHLQVASVVRLLHAWEADPQKRIICLAEEVTGLQTCHGAAILSLLSQDWPGMADSVIAAIHDHGWNVFIHRGIVLSYRGHALGVLLLVICLETEEMLKRYLERKSVLLERITRAAFGTRAMSALLAREARKVEMFSRVVELLDGIVRPPSLPEITGTDGEAVKFFAGRTVEYLTERYPDSLARQILMNNRLLKATRSTGGAIKFHVENVQTVRERLTTITISGLEREVSLDDCLQAVARAVGRFRLKYNKEFTTGDGITIYRIEIVDGSGQPFPQESLQEITAKLAEMASGKRYERSLWIESIGGYEHFARAIIPLLVKEFMHTGIPQVFLSASRATSEHIYFKIVMVVPPGANPGESTMFRCIPLLDANAGLLVQTTKPPKEMEGCELDILDLRADMTKFDGVEAVFNTIREILGQVIGSFRDFDEGMRRSDKDKLKEVRSRLPDVEEAFLRECYYRIEDFYRVGAPVEELTAIIDMAAQVLKDVEGTGRSWSVLHRTLLLAVEGGDTIPTATALAVAFHPHPGRRRRCLEVLEGRDFMMSRIDHRDFMVLVFRVTQENRPLPDVLVRDLIARLQAIFEEPVSPV